MYLGSNPCTSYTPRVHTSYTQGVCIRICAHDHIFYLHTHLTLAPQSHSILTYKATMVPKPCTEKEDAGCKTESSRNSHPSMYRSYRAHRNELAFLPGNASYCCRCSLQSWISILYHVDVCTGMTGRSSTRLRDSRPISRKHLFIAK